jgi:hypothetical protein
MPSLTLAIPNGSELEKTIKKELDFRIKMGEKAVTEQHKKWRQAEETVLAYVSTNELDAIRSTKRDQGLPAYTTIKIPYTYALLMSAHTYWTSVFFARTPVHQYSGRHGETEQQTQALEALVGYQIETGGAMGPYYIWLYDAGKYGIGVLGTYWDKEIFRFTTIDGVPGPDGKVQKVQTTKETVGFEGNRCYNVSPFDFYPDPRVTVGQFQKGEFCFVRKRISWNDIIRRKTQGYYTNIERIKTSLGTSDASTDQYSALIRPDVSSIRGDSDERHPSVVDAYEFYIELIPSDWELGTSTFPEKWVITISRDLSIVLGCQPLGLIHNQFPFDVMEIEIEAYGQYNRGIPEIMEGLQNTTDWLVNVHFFNTRAVLNNLFIADPTKLVMKDFEMSEPGGFIRMKPEAYGQDIDTFFKQIPIQDITQQNFTDLALIQNIGEKTLGVNDQIMGALSGAGRKTATEVRTSTGFGVNRLKTITEYLSATAFASHSQKLVMNSQQYFTAEKKFRIVGDLAMEAGEKFLMVQPGMIEGFFDFVPVDGVLPIDRIAQANLWKEILMNVGRVPQIAMAYDLSRIFAWMASIAGLKNINKFKIQVLPPGAAQPPGTTAIAAPPLGMPNGAMPASAPQDTGLMM